MDDQAANALKSSLQPKPVGDSASEMVEYVLPNDANALGTLLGGRSCPRTGSIWPERWRRIVMRTARS